MDEIKAVALFNRCGLLNVEMGESEVNLKIIPVEPSKIASFIINYIEPYRKKREIDSEHFYKQIHPDTTILLYLLTRDHNFKNKLKDTLDQIMT